MIVLNVEQILKDKGKSKEWLCDKMDISHYNLNKAIKGKTKSISFKYIQGFCTVLDCTFNELFSIIDDETEDKKGA